MSILPFSAVVGNTTLKQALLLTVIDINIGGLLIKGFRGSAKSTLARALAEVAGIESDKFVLLPLGADEARLLGSIDLQNVLDNGQVSFRPGLLHRAHQGILYVDEINLLSDPLVDLLLDVCGSGINTIERDGISTSHPAKFVFIGTMNPDEGELRPQLLDRFGLCVQLEQALDVEQRMQVVERRLRFDADPAAFIEHYRDQQSQLIEQVRIARQRLTDIRVSNDCQRYACETCLQAGVEGVRADITLRRAAVAFAAWQGLSEVDHACIDSVAEWVLAHRRPLHHHSTAPSETKAVDSNQLHSEKPRYEDASSDSGDASAQASSGPEAKSGEWGEMPPQYVPVGRTRHIDKVLPCEPTEKKNRKIDSAW